VYSYHNRMSIHYGYDRGGFSPVNGYDAQTLYFSASYLYIL
jgi:hypothetical protein